MLKLFDIGFLSLGIFDIVDILLFAFILYQVYNLIKGTLAVNIFVGLISIYLFWALVKALDMKLLSGVLDAFIGVGVIALIVVFQQEIRRFLILIGKKSIFSRSKYLDRILFKRSARFNKNRNNFAPVLGAVNEMARNKIGAIIVFMNNVDEFPWTMNGVELDSVVSRRLIESLFSKGSPLHDGAVIINKNRVLAASCILPVSEQIDLPARVGLRHRAALGASENNPDAFVIIVSEETGLISYAHSGELFNGIGLKDLEKQMQKIIY